MKERPILFNGAMMRAILDGSKTQTRRLVKGFQIPKLDTVQFDPSNKYIAVAQNHPRWGFCVFGSTEQECADQLTQSGCCPFGQVGDQLWVRETFAIVPRTAYRCSEGIQQVLRPEDDHDAAIYKSGWCRSEGGICWRPSIHMPRWASRIQLEITGVRIERLQNISRGGAMEEGCPFPNMTQGDDPRKWYAELWESISGAGSWDANPHVWVISFKKVAV